MGKKAWSGRFKGETDKLVEEFTQSISFDWRLYHYDIEGSIAYARTLARAKVITMQESSKIIQGLKEIEKEIEKGDFVFKTELEDIHMNIERRLIEKIGQAGGKLHTGRSRNDQISLDMRLYLKDVINDIISLIRDFQAILVNIAENKINLPMPGYTHLQRAQPVLFSHYLMAYFNMFQRDQERLQDCLKRVCVFPLGAGALAGTAYPVDREYMAKLLGFSNISSNSIDAVSDRDFIIEFLSGCANIAMHLSRLAEEIVLWSSTEFSFIELPDAFATGSSIMPQKKNPDVAELIRGKTGRVYGNLMALLTIMKGLPLTYNRDFQEDKEPLFDTADTIIACLGLVKRLYEKIKFNDEKMQMEAERNFSTATDMADYLVRKGLDFRSAHEIVGKIVSYCFKKGCNLKNLKLDEVRKYSPLFDMDFNRYLTLDASLNARRGRGGTSKSAVIESIKEAKKILKKEKEAM